jgi:copper oxidase (laccase) domain-containing protein
VAAIHAGWRGIAAGILQRAVVAMQALNLSPADLRVHLGPAICGGCYEVGRDVYYAVTGRSVPGHSLIDLRAELAGKVAALGVRDISISEYCTRCDNSRFFSHRAGDTGRQFAFIVADER